MLVGTIKSPNVPGDDFHGFLEIPTSKMVLWVPSTKFLLVSKDLFLAFECFPGEVCCAPTSSNLLLVFLVIILLTELLLFFFFFLFLLLSSTTSSSSCFVSFFPSAFFMSSSSLDLVLPKMPAFPLLGWLEKFPIALGPEWYQVGPLGTSLFLYLDLEILKQG